MAVSPTFASNPRSIDKVAVATANTNRDGTGTIATVAAGTTAGFKVNSVVAQATVTTTGGMIRLYISVDTGSTWFLFDEFPVAPTTVSATVAGSRMARSYTDLVLKGTTNLLGASTHNAENHNVFALGADL